ncbi:MAG: MBL fold metallo-hydrolase [Streptococcaceae bacterium]|nr:MBL fold metallo-hydrolase [Streptococcaceae bacterium]
MIKEKGFKYSILASGSTGNCTYIETPERKILVDAGLSGKKIEGLMHEIGRSLSDVDSLLVTHEHKDHVAGLGVLARKYKMTLYANAQTWQAIGDGCGQIDPSQKQLFEMGKTLTFGDIDVESFGVSHDAAAPQFYKFMKDGKSFVLLTDTGYVSDRIRGTIENADAYLMESNHDVEILRMGNYPWRLKQRILSDHGHLSNEDGASTALSVIGKQTKRILLGHRSQENNLKELAHMTMENTLMQHDIDIQNDVQVLDTSHIEASPLYSI